MKQTQEFEGKNLEQAIEKACAALNVTRKKLSYDVISSGSSGIFGIVGVKKAKIRVALPEKNIPESSVEESAAEADELYGVMSIVDEAFADPGVKEKELPPKRPKKSQPRRAASSGENIIKFPAMEEPRNSKEKERTIPEREEPLPFKEQSKTIPADEEYQTFKNNEVSIPEQEEPTAVGEKHPAEEPEILEPEIQIPSVETDDLIKDPTEEESEEEFEDELEEDFNEDFNEEIDDRDEGYPPKYKDEVPVDVSQESIDLGIKTLQQMVDLITTDSKVVSETDQDRLLLRVEGGNSGVLIGRRGQTLEAMQFLTDKIINRKSESRVRLKIDIEGYMETRKANLQSLAHKMAEKAKKTGKPATINQMTAQDRRIVHLALKDDPRVRTQSMGDGYYRRLVIFPKKNSFKKRKVTRI